MRPYVPYASFDFCFAFAAVVAAAAVVVVSEFVVVVARAINFVNKIDFGTTTRSSHLKNFG